MTNTQIDCLWISMCLLYLVGWGLLLYSIS